VNYRDGMSSASEPPDFAGMTLNERLFASGLLNRFDAAVRDGNRDEVVRLLIDVGLDEASAVRTATTVLSEPSRYGRLKGS